MDLERGSYATTGVKYNVLKEAELRGVDPIKEIFLLGKTIKEAKKPYKYVIIDTVTALEDLCVSLANFKYRQTQMGKDFTGNVLALPQGAGYYYLRESMLEVTREIYSWSDRIIMLGHLKNKNIEKNGKEVIASEIDLTGKIKSILSAEADAIGLLYRSNNNQNTVSFVTSDEVICGSRSTHLRNQEIILTTLDPKTNEIKSNWNQIYID